MKYLHPTINTIFYCQQTDKKHKNTILLIFSQCILTKATYLLNSINSNDFLIALNNPAEEN